MGGRVGASRTLARGPTGKGRGVVTRQPGWAETVWAEASCASPGPRALPGTCPALMRLSDRWLHSRRRLGPGSPPTPPVPGAGLSGCPPPAPSTCSPSSLDLTSVFDQQDEGHSSKSRSCKNSHKRVMLPWLESLLGAQKHDDPCLRSGGGGPFSAPSCFLF